MWPDRRDAICGNSGAWRPRCTTSGLALEVEKRCTRPKGRGGNLGQMGLNPA